MKKCILFVLSLALLIALFVPCVSYALDAQYQTVKVGIYYSSTAKSQVLFASTDGFTVGYMNDSAFVPESGLWQSENSAAYSSAGTVNINGTEYSCKNGNVALYPINGSVNINGTIYRGGVEFYPSSGKLTVINFVNINDYIAAVVGKEMSPSWNIEALKAQAVCARSYCIATWNRHSSLGFNMCSLQDCQTYMGISGETESTKRAASETKDQVVMYGSSVATTVYSASDGGSTAYSKHVWGGDIPYLQAVEDIYENPNEAVRSSWTNTFTKSDIKSKLAASGINIGEVTDMKVTGKDEYGRVYEVTIYGTNGNHVLKNEKTRSLFNLYSQKYTISSSGKTADSEIYAASSEGIKIITDNVIAKVYVDGLLTVRGGASTKTYKENESASSTGDTFTINGSGWGHGVGMSQYGAKAMADQGFGYKDILTFYYKGTYIA